jgi:exonuclease III
MHLQLKGMLPTATDLIHILCCYMPHSKSTQLHDLDLMARYSQLTDMIDTITTLQPRSLIVVAGDFIAKVGTDLALSSRAVQAIVECNAATDTAAQLMLTRSQQHPELDYSGTLLNDMCTATHMVNLTGLTHGYSPAAVFFASHQDARARHRLDHVLISPAAVAHLEQHLVAQHILGSDHYPIRLSLNLVHRSQTNPEQQVDLMQIIPSKDTAAIQRYVTAAASAQFLTQMRELASAGQASADRLSAAMNTAITHWVLGSCCLASSSCSRLSIP